MSTNTETPTTTIRRHHPSAWTFLLSVGGFFSLIGVLSLAVPMVAAVAIEMLIGVSLLVFGLSLAIFAFQSRAFQNVVAVSIFAAMFIIVGLWMLVSPLKGIAAISLLLAILFTLEGVGRLIYAFRLPPYFSRTLPIIEGIAGVAIGLFFWANWPGDSAWLIGLLVGIRFLLAGLTLIAFAFAVKKLEDTNADS